MGMRHYDSYRGRGRARTFLKVLIAVLLIALAAAAAAFFLLDRRLVISAGGYRLLSPFSRQDGAGALPDGPGTTPALVVETPAVTPVSQPEPLRGVLLPRSALYDGTADSLVAAAGGGAAVFDMKADDGTLAFRSQQPLAEAGRVNDENPAINAAIKGLNAGDLYTVARVSCFRDNAVPYRNSSVALRSQAGNWRDGDGIRWLSPASQQARDYVAGLCAELAQLGFDEILLDFAGYPIDGRLGSIVQGDAYDPDHLGAAVADFYAQAAQALEPYPQVRLSIAAGRELLSGEEDRSGQTPALLAQYADRIWVDTPEDGVFQPAAGFNGLQIVWRADAVPAGADSWAVPAGEAS